MVPAFGLSLTLCRVVEAICSVPRLVNWLLWAYTVAFMCDHTTQLDKHPLYWVPVGVVLMAWFWRDVGGPIYEGITFVGAPWYWRGTFNMFGACTVYLVVIILHRMLPSEGILHDSLVAVFASGIAMWIVYHVVKAEERISEPDGHVLPLGPRDWLRNVLE